MDEMGEIWSDGGGLSGRSGSDKNDGRWEQAGWSYDTLLDAQWMEDERAVVDGSWPTGRTTLFGKNSG